MMGFLFGREHRLRMIRKRWDRLRERSLRKKEPIRSNLLAKLDQIENNLRVLEERRSLTRFEQARLSKEIEIDLEGIRAMVESKQPEPQRYSQTEQLQQNQQKK
jgi:hypothetical protein